MAVLRLNFDHAIQYEKNNYYADYSSKTVTSGSVLMGTRYQGKTYKNEIYFEKFPFNIGEYKIKNAKLVCGSNFKSQTVTVYSDGSTNTRTYNDINAEYRAYMNPNASLYLWNFNATTKGNEIPIWYYSLREEFTKKIYEQIDYNLFAISDSPEDPFGTDSKYYSLTEIYNVEETYIEVEYEPVQLIVTPVYPINVNVTNTKDATFTWVFNNSENRTEDWLYATKYEITIKQLDNIKNYESTTNSVVIPADDFVAGKAKYKIKVYSNYGTTGESEECEFTFIGKTDAPEINFILQSNFPVFGWEIDEQKAFELNIYDASGLVYGSGIIISEKKYYVLPIMIENGEYYVEIRALNSYGYYTDWSTIGFVLNPSRVPEPVENVLISANPVYGITIDCTVPEGNDSLYVMRRRNEFDKPVLVGEFKKGFIDYKIPLNTSYQYTVRRYMQNYGIADSTWIDGEVKTEGVVIRDSKDASNYIHLWKNSSIFDVSSDDERSDVLVNVVGRPYPIKEVGEWIASTRTFSAYVDDEDYKKLIKMNINSNSVYYQSNEEIILCHMRIRDGGRFVDQGRIVNFELTRIDGE